ncbi:MAG: hypothetical protein WDN08_12390 [Rhizomicrobium sp.]
MTEGKELTGNNYLDGQKPGDIYKGKDGNIYEVVDVFGPQLSETARRKLRRDAFRLNAATDIK